MFLVCQTTPAASVTCELRPPITNVRTGVRPITAYQEDFGPRDSGLAREHAKAGVAKRQLLGRADKRGDGVAAARMTGVRRVVVLSSFFVEPHFLKLKLQVANLNKLKRQVIPAAKPVRWLNTHAWS